MIYILLAIFIFLVMVCCIYIAYQFLNYEVISKEFENLIKDIIEELEEEKDEEEKNEEEKEQNSES